MSEVSAINEISLVNFEGIENITKFKYRTTLPKYPKPGTFYWIEQNIEGQPKLGIYFTTNDCELKRLDSKIYDLVVKDPDGYLVITEKDAFDVQEIYLVMGNFEKEDILIEDGSKNGTRVFKITKEENKGLATVEGVVEYISDSNNMLYMSNAEDYWWTGVRLGDIRKGRTKEDLKNQTISEVLDTIIYPTLQPEIEEQPQVFLDKHILDGIIDVESVEDGHFLVRIDKLLKNSINVYEDSDSSDDDSETESKVDEESDLSEIENVISTTVEDIVERFHDYDVLKNYVTYTRGRWTYPTDEEDDNGEKYTLCNYAGKPESDDEGNLKINLLDTVPQSSELDYKLDMSYKLGVYLNFANGPIPRDNKRNIARYEDMIETCDCENGCLKCYKPNFISQNITSNILSVDVVYPIYINCINAQNKSIRNVTEYPLINYHLEGGGVAYVEIPKEMDGYNEVMPLKLCIDAPQQLNVDVYQYNELCHTYDVKVDMKWIYTEVRFNTVYNRLMRTKDKYNTNIESVKYKIIISKK